MLVVESGQTIGSAWQVFTLRAVALVKISDSTDVGWALLPVLRALSRPRVANLRLNQPPVELSTDAQVFRLTVSQRRTRHTLLSRTPSANR